MAYGEVQGKVIRLTKIDRCGLPIQGPANRLVTDGFIRVNADPELKARNDIETTNAAGDICVSASKAAIRKWWNLQIDFCQVDPEAFNLLTSWPMVIDHNGNPIGFRDSDTVDSEYGVAIEIWTGVPDDDSCDIPVDDSIFSTLGTGVKSGYTLLGATEFMSGPLTTEDGAATFQMNGRTIAMPRWGRGPYNVAGTDDDGTPGRLLAPTSKKEHITKFWTPVPPPEPTNGSCELAVQSIFDTGEYFGAGAVDVAPPQPICNGVVYDLVVTGTGNFKASVATVETANIAHTALPAAVQTAIENLPNVEVGQVQVTGVAGNYDVTLAPELGVLGADGTGLSGGTATVTPH